MQMVSADILAEMCGMSLGLLVIGAAIGLTLWLAGCWSHRFWVVFGATTTAGVFGLLEASVFKAPPLLAALLMAVSAGMLALHLVRLFAFVAGGLVGVHLVHAVAPTFEQPLIIFLAVGLVHLFLFRLCMMALTSLIGSVLLCHCGLSLLNHYGTLDAVAWTDQGAVLLNWICGLMAVLGMAFQFLADRRRESRKEKSGKGRKDDGPFILSLPNIFGWGKSRKAV